MARSTYIYLVTENNKPYAAFTVKHEMETYLQQFCGNYSKIKIFRMRDNPNIWNPGQAADITEEVLSG